MQIVDEMTGEVLPAVSGSSMPSFVINMNGVRTRTFRWELLTQNTEALAPAAATAKAAMSLRSVKASAQTARPAFDLDKPPVFDERQ